MDYGWGAPKAKRQRQWAPPDEVETFIMNNGLDERAANDFRSAGPQIQRSVLDKGQDLSMCKNASSAVVGRIRDAKREAQQGHVPSTASPEVMNFIQMNNIDDAAACLLKASDVQVQLNVLGQGLDLSQCSNPSSVVIRRIQEAKKEVLARNRMAQGQGIMGFGMQGQGMMGFGLHGQGMMGSGVQAQAMMGVKMQKPGAPPSPDELEAFIMNNSLDERAAADLRNSGPSIQRKVLDKGQDLSMCSNASSAVIGRIRDVKQDIQRGQVSTAVVPGVQNFCDTNNLDDGATSLLKASDPNVQLNVLNQGLDLSQCGNPSSVVIKRIQEAKKEVAMRNRMVQGQGLMGAMMQPMLGTMSKTQLSQSGFMQPGFMGVRAAAGGFGGCLGPLGGVFGGPAAEVEQFIMMNNVDVRAGSTLRAQGPAIQKYVLDQGVDLSLCSNPSAVVVGRIQDAKNKPELQESSGVASEVINFCLMNGIDERATSTLKASDPMVQRSVLDKGLDLSLCTNPSSVVISRIKDAKNEMGDGTTGTVPAKVEQFNKAKLKKDATLNIDSAISLDAWLTKAKLKEYASAIKDYGYNSFKALLVADQSELEEMMEALNMKKPHRKLMLSEWGQLHNMQ